MKEVVVEGRTIYSEPQVSLTENLILDLGLGVKNPNVNFYPSQTKFYDVRRFFGDTLHYFAVITIDDVTSSSFHTEEDEVTFLEQVKHQFELSKYKDIIKDLKDHAETYKKDPVFFSELVENQEMELQRVLLQAQTLQTLTQRLSLTTTSKPICEQLEALAKISNDILGNSPEESPQNREFELTSLLLEEDGNTISHYFKKYLLGEKSIKVFVKNTPKVVGYPNAFSREWE